MALPIPRLLIVEDDTKTARSLVAGLQAEGFVAHAARNGRQSLKNFKDFI
jgi:DNA-binding response OmpR family regulator